jgi:hypothetical protein
LRERVIHLGTDPPKANGEKKMKLNHVILLSALMLSASGFSQTGGGATGGTGTGSGTSGTGSTGGTTPGAPGGSSFPTRPGLPPPDGFPRQRPLTPNSQPGQVGQQRQLDANSPNSPGSTSGAVPNSTGVTANQPGVETNQVLLNTNQFSTNQSSLAQPSTSSSSTSGANGSRTLPPPGILPQPQSVQNPLAPQQREAQATQSRGNPQAAANNPNLNAVGVNTNLIAVDTNQLASSTNPIVANTNLTPTSQLGFTNRILSSNTAGVMTNTSPMLMRDQALSETDRRLLAQIRGAVFGANAATMPSAGAPIHFILKDGIVRLVGTVSTMEERQRIENLVQQVPGVVRVFDALQVSQSGAQPSAQ